MTEYEKMLAGAPHQPYDAVLVATRHRCRSLLWRYNTQIPPHDDAARAALLTELLGALPEGIHISAPFYCDYGRHIHAGKRFYTIGAGSVVSKDIPAGVIAVGNPCRVLRAISDADREQYAARGIRAG
nr:maltose acetyltransferase domain-containing protein [uncultured Cardiobacterium sp.]